MEAKKCNFRRLLLVLLAWGPVLYAGPVSNGSLTVGATGTYPGAQHTEHRARKNSRYDGVILRAVPSKSTVYQGEHFTVTYKIYYQVSISDPVFARDPDFAGCYKELLPAARESTREEVGGEGWNVVAFQKYLVVPQQSGTLVISPRVLQLRLRLPPDSGDFFGVEREVVHTVTSPAASVNVLPLPGANQPPDFSGIVGQYAIKTMLRDDTITARQVANLHVILTGVGNAKFVGIKLPEVNPELEIYASDVVDEVQATAGGYQGSKTFTFKVVGGFNGTYALPPLDFWYFDPYQERYMHLQTPDQSITITGGRRPSEKAFAKASRAVVGHKLFLKSRFTHRDYSGVWSAARYWLLLVLLILLQAGAFTYRYLLQQEGYLKNALADAVGSFYVRHAANKALVKLRKEMPHTDSDDFYGRLTVIFRRYLASQLRLPQPTVTTDIIPALVESKVPLGLQRKVSQLLQQIDQQRFSNLSRTADSRSHYLQEVSGVIQQLGRRHK